MKYLFALFLALAFPALSATTNAPIVLPVSGSGGSGSGNPPGIGSFTSYPSVRAGQSGVWLTDTNELYVEEPTNVWNIAGFYRHVSSSSNAFAVYWRYADGNGNSVSTNNRLSVVAGQIFDANGNHIYTNNGGVLNTTNVGYYTDANDGGGIATVKYGTKLIVSHVIAGDVETPYFPSAATFENSVTIGTTSNQLRVIYINPKTSLYGTNIIPILKFGKDVGDHFDSLPFGISYDGRSNMLCFSQTIGSAGGGGANGDLYPIKASDFWGILHGAVSGGITTNVTICTNGLGTHGYIEKFSGGVITNVVDY